MKLYITDTGDPSVGISSQTFEVDTPFNKEEVDQDGIDWFKEKILKIYREFSIGNLLAIYDDELQEDEIHWV